MDDTKQKRQSHVLANSKFVGAEARAQAVIGALFLRSGPETQDRVAAALAKSTRQHHLRDELMATLKGIGIDVPVDDMEGNAA